MAKFDIIAATGCPTGIAHTFMAKEALEKAAAERGLTIKVETHGQVGVENELTKGEIAGAKAVVVAADKDVQAERFAGKPMVSVGVSKALSVEAAGKLIDRALAGGEVAFLGYLVVSLIQLGATIDYAILYTKNYTDMRRQYGKKMALEKALAISFPSVLTSAAILSCAGFMVGLTSTVAAVKQIGLMLGRGALISGVLVVLFLPPLLLLFDHYIQKLSLRMHFVKEEKGGELPDDYHDHALEESTSTREEGGDERPEPESEPDVPHS